MDKLDISLDRMTGPIAVVAPRQANSMPRDESCRDKPHVVIVPLKATSAVMSFVGIKVGLRFQHMSAVAPKSNESGPQKSKESVSMVWTSYMEVT